MQQERRKRASQHNSIPIKIFAYRVLCYNYKVKRRLFALLCSLLYLVVFLTPLSTPEQKSLSDLLVQIQKSLESRDMSSYLKNFSADTRMVEELSLKDKFDLFQVDSVSLFPASPLIESGDKASLFVQVLFENSYSAIIESWHLKLIRVNSSWQIREKQLTGNVSSLYKVRIPSERIERVESIVVEHKDIRLVFEDALVFYDNIPDLETALLILGRGRLHFSPSDAEERHQLQLTYKKSILEDDLSYAFLRFSDRFFRNNIKIVNSNGEKNTQPSSQVLNEASIIFSNHYGRSFTIENSLNNERLSTLPQSDEAVFGFKGKKLGELTYIYSSFADEEINLFRWKDERILNLYSPLDDENRRRLFLSFAQMYEFKRYQIELSFKPEQYFLSGKVRVEIEPKVDSLGRLKLKLNPELQILRIYDDERRELFYSRDRLRETLYIYFLQPPPKDQPYAVEIYYRGKVVPLVQVADVVAGPQIHKWGGQYGQNIVFLPPHFETYLYSRRNLWYPAPADDEYFQARMRISVPADYQCVSNGERVESGLSGGEAGEEAENPDMTAYVFETKYPVKYLSFIVGKFTIAGEDPDTPPLRHLYSSGVNFQRKGILEDARNILRFYEERFGSFPYEKLSIVRRLWITSGGHSPASFLVLNELPQIQDGSVLINVRSPVDLSHWKEYFIAHEIAHQWWGQAVTWKTYRDQWLSEGLAQFAAALYLGEKHGPSTFSTVLAKFSHWTKRHSKWGPITLGSRLAYHDPSAFQAIVYNKTSLVLNMLKDLVGEEVFYEGLRMFFSRYRYSAASTGDFIRVMEEVSGTDLKGFFKNWFYSYLLPEVKVSQSFSRAEEGGFILKLKLHQMKQVFVFPLWLEWTENGETIRRMVVVDEKNSAFTFHLKAKPKRIKINPDSAVPGNFR